MNADMDVPARTGAADVQVDILVVGGGIPGLACAALLARDPLLRRRRLSVGVLERRVPAAVRPEEGPGLRVLALSPASQAVLESVEAWQPLPAALVSAYRRMVVWHESDHPGGRDSISFEAAEFGLPELGHIVDHDGLRHALWVSAVAAGAVPVAGRQPVALAVDGDRVRIALDDGRTVAARLVLGADGADSWVRRQLRIACTGHVYGQCALVTHVQTARPHGETAWQRFLADGPVALLPLADGRSSVVWSCAEDAAGELLEEATETFERRLGVATGHVLGEVRLAAPRAAFPLAVRHAHRYTGERFALLGDAAHQVHPLAGQGVNLGLLDAAALAESLVGHLRASALADPGDRRALRRYERWRKEANLITLGTMDGLHRLFTSRLPLVSRVAGLGLGVVDRLIPAKRMLASRALGRSGRLPVAAGGRGINRDGHRRPDAEI